MMVGNALWLVGIVAEAVLVGLLLYKRVWRTFPLFFAYCVWDVLSNAGTYGAQQFFLVSLSLKGYLAETVVDSILQISVLMELAWSVLHPRRAHLSRKGLLAGGGILIIAGALVWPFASLANVNHLNGEMATILQLQHTAAILRILFFVCIASCSQLLSIDWRDRELQIATGFGFYSLFSLAVVVVHPHEATSEMYRALNSIVIGSFVCSLLYWVYSFLKQEAPRREFTPEMRALLQSIAGAASSSRIVLASSHPSIPEKPGKQ